MTSIPDLINDKIKKKEKFFSFEFFCPKTQMGTEHLFRRIKKLAKLKPLFADVTWGAGGSTKRKTIDIANKMQNEIGIPSQIHMTLTGLSQTELIEKLKEAKDKKLTNVLCLRGDAPKAIETGKDNWKETSGGLKYASDFVKLVRSKFGKDLSLSVAGYPEGHPKGSYAADLKYLKQKYDNGAEFVITQFFYDVGKFVKFCEDAKKLGINCPIIPGIMPIYNLANFHKMVNFCKVKLPPWMQSELKDLKVEDKVGVVKFGIRSCIRVCKELISHGIKGFHFYTLNLSKSVITILKEIGYLGHVKGVTTEFPWKARRNEMIRPIFWSNRPESYLLRTQDWDELPIGPSFFINSPAFGSVDFHSISNSFKNGIDEKRKKWGTNIKSYGDLSTLFCNFLLGKIDSLPWVSTNIFTETSVIQQKLLDINKKGFLSINSQPKANGISSEDKIHGWGGKGGYIYKKSYLEFFCSLDLKEELIKEIKKHPTLSFYCINANGDKCSTNTPKGSVTTVTWGVFPNCEILQPTIVDDHTFLSWKDEAFALWLSWANVYDKESKEHKYLTKVHKEFYLMNIIDHDYINGNIWKVFENVKGIKNNEEKK